jgi:hypothetical protein
MGAWIGRRQVHGPSGTEWRIGRVWIGRRGPRLRRISSGSSDSAWELANWVPFDVGGDWADLEAMMLVIIAITLIVFVLIPLLLFGVELIILGLVVAAGVIGRVLRRRPWLVRAESAGGPHVEMAWKVSGWRHSSQAIDAIASALAAGIEPTPEHAEQVPPAATLTT